MWASDEIMISEVEAAVCNMLKGCEKRGRELLNGSGRGQSAASPELLESRQNHL